jgi:hypothetical protein
VQKRGVYVVALKSIFLCLRENEKKWVDAKLPFDTAAAEALRADGAAHGRKQRNVSG